MTQLFLEQADHGACKCHARDGSYIKYWTFLNQSGMLSTALMRDGFQTSKILLSVFYLFFYLFPNIDYIIKGDKLV